MKPKKAGTPTANGISSTGSIAPNIAKRKTKMPGFTIKKSLTTQPAVNALNNERSDGLSETFESSLGSAAISFIFFLPTERAQNGWNPSTINANTPHHMNPRVRSIGSSSGVSTAGRAGA